MKPLCFLLIAYWVMMADARAALLLPTDPPGGIPAVEQVTIPLTDLRGIYSTGDFGPYQKDLSVDLHAQFDRIDAVRLTVKGTVAPALRRGYSLVGAGGQYEYEYYPILEFLLHTASYWGPSAALRDDGAFEAKLPFGLSGVTYDWSFLFDGKADLYFVAPGPAVPATEVQWQVVPAVTVIEEAWLTVEGHRVPEPASALVILPSLIALALRRR